MHLNLQVWCLSISFNALVIENVTPNSICFLSDVCPHDALLRHLWIGSHLSLAVITAYSNNICRVLVKQWRTKAFASASNSYQCYHHTANLPFYRNPFGYYISPLQLSHPHSMHVCRCHEHIADYSGRFMPKKFGKKANRITTMIICKLITLQHECFPILLFGLTHFASKYLRGAKITIECVIA